MAGLVLPQALAEQRGFGAIFSKQSQTLLITEFPVSKILLSLILQKGLIYPSGKMLGVMEAWKRGVGVGAIGIGGCFSVVELRLISPVFCLGLEELVHQRLRKTLTHVLELSSCVYLDDRAWGVLNFDSAGMRINLRRTSVTGFPAQSISSSNTIALDSPNLLVLNTGASQSKQHGKFKEKVDEGFLVGYSVNSKAFRVFNSRTRILQETLHVDEGFLVGYSVNSKAFRVFNSRTRILQETLHSLHETNLTPVQVFKENLMQKRQGEANQQYMLFPVWSTGSSNPQNKKGDTAFDGKEHDAEKPEFAVNLSPSSSALSGEQDDMTKKKDKGKSHIEYFTRNRDLNVDFKDYSEDISNDVSVVGPIVPTVGQNYSNSTNPFSAAGPSNTNTSPTHGTIEEEVYVCQPLGFEDPGHPDKVYKVVKALYGLHQALRAWYETL
nr:reverse transcriptase [Tanacetum cinerariifolium]